MFPVATHQSLSLMDNFVFIWVCHSWLSHSPINRHLGDVLWTFKMHFEKYICEQSCFCFLVHFGWNTSRAFNRREIARIGWQWPQRYIHVLISQTCNCYLIWKRVFAEVTKLRTLISGEYPGSSRWALNAITSVLLRGEIIDRRGQDNVIQAQRYRLEGCGHKQRNAGIPQELKEARFSPTAFPDDTLTSS